MIKWVRVDHRLLHGQVAFSWTKFLDTDCILIANDGVAGDQLRMSALRMAKPEGIKLVIKSMDDSISAIRKGVTDKYKLFILLETVEDAYRLTKGINTIKKINLGGAKLTDNKKQISKAFSVSESDIKMIKEMNQNNIDLEIQMIPEDPEKNVIDLI